MDTLIAQIDSYLRFLISERLLYVSLHPFGQGMCLLDTPLRIYNIHRHEYCLFLKGVAGVWKKCVRCQEKAWKKSENGEFYGVCHGGVGEYVYPLQGADGRSVGFISVSGYAPPDRADYAKHLSAEFALSLKQLRQASQGLLPCPAKEEVDKLIHPLCRMLELYFIRQPLSEPKSFDQRVIAYLHAHYKENITSREVCEALFCSRSYLSHRFRNKHGKGLREYITDLRLQDAAKLLAYSEMSISEVAAATGFADTNYFSKTFKKAMGCSPIRYRKEKAP